MKTFNKIKSSQLNLIFIFLFLGIVSCAKSANLGGIELEPLIPDITQNNDMEDEISNLDSDIQDAFLFALQNGGEWTSVCGLGMLGTDFIQSYKYDGTSLSIFYKFYNSFDGQCGGALLWHTEDVYHISFPEESHQPQLETILNGNQIDYAFKVNLILEESSVTVDHVLGASSLNFFKQCLKRDWQSSPGVGGTYDRIAESCLNAGRISYYLLGLDVKNRALYIGSFGLYNEGVFQYDGTTESKRPIYLNPLEYYGQ